MVIGITGSIACGKSLITDYLKEHNYNVVDSDDISHYVLTIKEVRDEIVSSLPNDDVLTNGEIDRKKLGKIIFSNANKKTVLESIVFPHIQREIKRQLSKYNGLVFLDAPLLLEYNLEYLVDKIIVVRLDQDIQLERLMCRDNISYEYALAKINSQWPLEEKEEYANFIIDNSKDKEHAINQLKEILKIVEE